MSSKGYIRGPQHFTEPRDFKPALRTGIRVTRHGGTTNRGRYERLAYALLEHPNEWICAVRYPPELAKTQSKTVKIASSMCNRLMLTGRPGGVKTISNVVRELYGLGAFDAHMVQAEMDRLPDGTIEVWVRWGERAAVA